MTWRLNWLAALLFTIVAASACGFGASPDNKEIEAAITSYYAAIQRNDEAAQVNLWVPTRQDEALRQAKAWETRSRDGLKFSSLHIESTQEPNLKVVHYYLGVADRRIPEGKAALMETVDGAWRFRELQ